MGDNQSIYEYLFSSRELLDSGDLTEKEAGILSGKIQEYIPRLVWMRAIWSISYSQ